MIEGWLLHRSANRNKTRIMREIVFDTETTGLDCLAGDRLIEIGCVELVNHIPTGRTFHRYLNPKRAVAYEAGLVHGLTDEFLRSQPCFGDIAEALAEFIGDSALIAHNAGFDRGFINMELGLCGRTPLAEQRFVDTLLLARQRHPNAPNSLDALCARYGIDTSMRSKHGALLDAKILAEVYLELIGGRQASLSLGTLQQVSVGATAIRIVAVRPRPLAPRLTAEDEVLHQAFLATLGAEPIWNRYKTQEYAAAS
jgi:DNA polymerase-3 subunit epsilon